MIVIIIIVIIAIIVIIILTVIHQRNFSSKSTHNCQCQSNSFLKCQCHCFPTSILKFAVHNQILIVFFWDKSLWPALEKTVHCKISSIYWKIWYFPWRNTVVLKTRNTFQRKAGHTGKVEINFSSEKSAEEDVRKVPEEFKYFWKMPTLTEIPDLVLLPPEAWGIVVNFFINHLWNFYKYNQSHNHWSSTTRIIAGGLLCGRCRGSWRAGLSFWPGSPPSSQIVEHIDIISLTPFFNLLFNRLDL